MLLRVLAQFLNNPDADACAAAFHAEREQLEAACLERYQLEKGRRIVLAAHVLVVQQGQAVIQSIEHFQSRD